MYRLLELGDCFLITFTVEDKTSHLLIDCGSFRNDGSSVGRLRAIVEDIAEVLGGKPLDVVVGTHQHNDHVSGFFHCESAFRAMSVDQVWLSWLDDPADERAQAIGKAHHNLLQSLTAARDALPAARKAFDETPGATRALEVLDDMLGSFGATAAGAAPQIPAEGMEILRTLGTKDPLYLSPGRTLEMPGLGGRVRVHVLGPPRRDDLLRRRNPRRGESYDHALASAELQAAKLSDAAIRADEEQHYPFNGIYKRLNASDSRRPSEPKAGLPTVIDHYENPGDEWRKIDDAWMESAGALALYLHELTNNSSLVLAIELVESGKVLLFAADAQTGNWLSWNEVKWDLEGVSTDELLARTVFYKVGHHGSHNATLPAAFAKMTHRQLVAFIPVHKDDPNIARQNGGWKMPAKALLEKLQERTKNRVLRMDDEDSPDRNAAWQRIDVAPEITPLAIKLEIWG
jgi:beta-lactamase superfamily II metal-dependent hydrolase